MIAPSSDVYNCPTHVPLDLWLTLRSMHNESQLWAIKHVATCIEDTQGHDSRNHADTQISLIQGPPGTGKTFTILGRYKLAHYHHRHYHHHYHCYHCYRCYHHDHTGMLSVLLHESNDKAKRVLLCAPSNAAVDELLTRLLAGIIGSDGCRRHVNIVRLGKLPSDTPIAIVESIKHLTLDEKVEEVINESGLKDQKHALKQEIEIVLGKIGVVRTQRSSQMSASSSLSSNAMHSDNNDNNKHSHHHNTKATLARYYAQLNNLYSKRHQLEDKIDKMRITAAQDVIQQAEVVISTLSSSGQYTHTI